MDIDKKIEDNAAYINEKLGRLFAGGDGDISRVIEAMKYSTLAGGKRIRPFLVMSVCEALDGDRYAAERFALAIELIHTYSLIHDDLPCMDDDDYRRGKLTCHKVYGESTAVLAGDALLTRAFGLISEDERIASGMRLKAISVLSAAAGYAGMIGGQIIDLESEGRQITYEELARMHSLKTGALIRAACSLGCISAGIFEGKTYESINKYAEGIGRVFQLVDDILDVTATSEQMGKPAHSDEKNNKTTYLSFVSIDMARQIAELITEKATECIKDINNRETLESLAVYLKDRAK